MYRRIPQADDSGDSLEKWLGAAELEWAKVHGGILYNKWYLLDIDDTKLENFGTQKGFC